MFNPDGCFCCEPPEDPCVLSGCTWSSTEMSDADLTSGVTYHNPASGSTPDGTYEVTNIQDTSTGNDAPCRKITIETAVAPSKAESVYAICWKDGATHNPATQCPLTNVSFCVESKRHGDSDSGLTDSVVFVVRQGGKIYATAAQSVGVNWKRASGTYTSASFTWVNGTGNPNFTATGSAIEFGLALKLSVPKDGTPYDVVMFDNLCIKRNCQTTCGCNCSMAMTFSGISVSATSYNPLLPFPQDAIDFYNDTVSSVIVTNAPVDFGGGTCQWRLSIPYYPIDNSYFNSAAVIVIAGRQSTGVIFANIRFEFNIPGSTHSWTLLFTGGMMSSLCEIVNPAYASITSGGSYPYIAINLSSPTVSLECA